MATLAEIRAKLQKQQEEKSDAISGKRSGGDNQIFPHWNIEEGQTATLRFLPDADPTNTFFWIERSMIRLPFPGVLGDASSRPVDIQVPCMETWNESCPILNEVRPWFKSGDKSLEEMGRRYWKKRSYLFQGFVVDNKLEPREEQPENPIRRFVISSQIINIIKNALMDPEIDELPTDYLRGLDFKIVKTSKGGYADYSTSTWARRERALTDVELAAIEKYGLYDLKEFLPKKPTDIELKVMMEMFEASVAGDAYDAERWSQYFRPNGMRSSTEGSSSSTIRNYTPKATDVDENGDEEEEQRPVERVAAPVATAPVERETSSVSSDAKNRAMDIVAKLAAKRKAEQQG